MKKNPWLVGLVLALGASVGRADDPIDNVLERNPDIAMPKVVRSFPDKLPGLWFEALGRPEADMRCQAAMAIAKAHAMGMGGLAITVPALTRELERPDQHSSVALAAAKALVALDAKDSAPGLFKLASAGDLELREIIEAALARWNFAPAREDWLKRLNAPAPRGRSAILAIRSLATAREPKAVPRLRELVLSVETPSQIRLEAAKALGTLRKSGAEADAELLAADASAKGMLARLAGVWLLRHHSGDRAIRQLQSFARDAEPSVAVVALTRLVELDPAHVEPILASALGSTDANARGLGVEVLFRRPSDSHIQQLGERLSDAHPDVHSQARRALRELAGKFRTAVLAECERALAGADWRGREQAAILYAQLDHKPAALKLTAVLSDERPEAAIAAAWGLRVLAVPETLPNSLAHFVRHTAKPDPPEWRDRQLGHLAQQMGQARYTLADTSLRVVVPPNNRSGVHTRAAASWALGLIHEGKPVPELAATLAGRVSAVRPFDVELEPVRTMCAISLARMKAAEQLPTLRTFYTDGKPSFNKVNNACAWAIEQLTGEKVPPPGELVLPQRAWFLVPID